jgi:hypothetical protein
LDNVTGLAWEAKTTGNVETTYDWAGAKSYAEGFTGCGATYTCRLPTVKELLGIVHFGKNSAPFIDGKFFPTTYSGTYYTGTAVANSSSVWGVDFTYGTTDTLSGSGYRARAVCVPVP